MEPAAKVAVNFRLRHDVVERIASEANALDIAQTAFVEEALREKFDRIDTGESAGHGPLAGLSKSDRERVIRFVECLRVAPEGRGFRRAVDANFAWLMETIES